MARLKQPQKLLLKLYDFVKDWLLVLINVIAINDIENDGNYSEHDQKILREIRDHLETNLPLETAEKLLSQFCEDISTSTQVKFAALNILHFPERSRKLSLGKSKYGSF